MGDIVQRHFNSYFAGLFEGEGFVGLQSRRLRSGHRSYCVRIGILLTDFEPLAELQANVGGNITVRPRQHVGHRDAYVWMTTGARAGGFLRSVKPFLRSPRAKARVAVALAFEAERRRRDAYMRRTAEEIERQDALFEGLRRLNGRGSRTPTPEERTAVLMELGVPLP